MSGQRASTNVYRGTIDKEGAHLSTTSFWRRAPGSTPLRGRMSKIICSARGYKNSRVRIRVVQPMGCWLGRFDPSKERAGAPGRRWARIAGASPPAPRRQIQARTRGTTERAQLVTLALALTPPCDLSSTLPRKPVAPVTNTHFPAKCSFILDRYGVEGTQQGMEGAAREGTRRVGLCGSKRARLGANGKRTSE